MRVLVLHRPSGMIGGDTGAALGLASGLRARGWDVVARGADDLAGLKSFDVAVLYAAVSPDWGLPAARAIKAAGVPLVVVPIWWSRRPRLDFYHLGADLYPGYTAQVAAILKAADLLAVYTTSEALECWKLVPRHKAFVMGAGFDGLPADLPQPDEIADVVVTVGRIEKHKNQVSLALACRELGVPLVCVGPVADAPYAAKAQALGGQLVGERSHRDTLVILSRARVYALPSFSENVSVASCEAAALGVPAVLGTIGCEPEYFGLGPTYCNPADWRDIAAAVASAWHRPRGAWATMPTWAEVAGRLAARVEAGL